MPHLGSCNITDPDFIIQGPEPVTWNTCRNMKGNIVVKPGGKLTIRCEVGMPRGGRIVVEPGGELFIRGGRVFSNCGTERWEGIVVQGNPALPQKKVNGIWTQGYLALLSHAVVEGAVCGARLFNPQVSNSGGGIIAVNGALFLNNIIGVDFGPFQNFISQTGQPIGNLSSFTQCEFVVNNGFPGSYTSFIRHAHLQSVTGIEFFACTFANDVSSLQPVGNAYNSAAQKGRGIQAVNSDFIVTGKCQNSDCTLYNRSEFRGLAQGVYATSYASGNTFRVVNSDFINNARGIDAQDVNHAYVVNNHFESGSDLPYNSNGQPFAGLFFAQSTGYMVEGNTFTKTSLGMAPGQKVVGSVIQDSGEQPNVIYRNTYSGLDFANLSNGVNRSDLGAGLEYHCNNNQSNQYDFVVSLEPGSEQGIAANQGSASESARNTFTQSPPLPQTHFLNQEAPITYFWQTGFANKPTNYSTATVTLPLTAAAHNLCSNQVPEDVDGNLTGNEEQEFASEWVNGTNPGKRTRAANMLIRSVLTDTLHQNLGEARTWLANKGDLRSRFAVVDTWLQEKDAASAEAALLNIPNQISLNARQQTEYDKFFDLKALQIVALQNEQSEADMVANNLSDLTLLAQEEYFASAQAHLLLNAHAGTEYAPLIILPSSGGYGLILPPDPNPADFSQRTQQPYVKALPNPARQVASFHFVLEEGVEQGRITLSSLNGKMVWEALLSEYSGKVEMDLKYMEEGIYLYSLFSAGKLVDTEKLVIKK